MKREERNRFLYVCRLYSSIRKRARRVCVCRFLLFAAYMEYSVTDFCRQQQRTHIYTGKRERMKKKTKKRRTINGRHQPSKGRVSWGKMMIIVISSAGTLLHQCSYNTVDEANRLLCSLTCNSFFPLRTCIQKRKHHKKRKQITNSHLVTVIIMRS